MAKRLSLSRAKRILKIDDNKLDWAFRFYANEIEFEALLPVQQDMLEKYRKAWGMLNMGRTMDMVRSVLMKDYAIQDRQARYIVEEAQILFGPIDEVDAVGRRASSISFYDLLSNIAFKEKDITEARMCRHTADELAGLHTEKGLGLNPEDFLKPAKFIFVNNVNVFKKQQDVIDIPLDE